MEKLRKTVNDYSQETKVLDEIILQYKQSLERFQNSQNLEDDSDLALTICHSLCNSLDMPSTIICVSDYFRHYVMGVKLNDKYYILDPTYKKYFKALKYRLNSHHILEKFHGLPGFFVIRNNEGKKFAKELVQKGYFECTEQNMKIYCDGFVLCKYNQGKKMKSLVYSNNISGTEYLNNVILRRFNEEITFQKHK